MTKRDPIGEGQLDRALTAPREIGAAVSHPVPDELVEVIAERFRVLSDPTRIKLLDRLREREASVLELTEMIGTTPQNVSKHLGVLQRAGILARRKQGNYVYYRIIDEGVFELCEAVCGSLQHQFASLHQLVTRASA